MSTQKKKIDRKGGSNREYSKLILDLKNKLINAVNEKKSEIYDEFSQNYLMSKTFWYKRFHNDSEKLFNNKNYAVKFFQQKYYHFCYEDVIDYTYNEFLYVYNLRPKLLHESWIYPTGDNSDLLTSDHPLMIKSLQFSKYPHSNIQKFLMWYEESSTGPIPKTLLKQCEKMKKYYLKIKSSENNLEQWIECLQESEDPEFVRQNIENPIGQKLGNKKLWKLYIEYLRKINNPKEMLQVYSKYCRFFLDDEDMREKYKKEVETYGPPVYVPWKNLFDFECSALPPENILENSRELLLGWQQQNITDDRIYLYPENGYKPEIYPNSLPSMNPSIIKNFFGNNSKCLKQHWPFPMPLIRFIVNKARPEISQKIQHTCKWFYLDKPKIYCHRLNYTDTSNYMDDENLHFLNQSLQFGWTFVNSALKPYNNKKLVIKMSLQITRDSNQLPRTFLSICIQNYIYECELKYICVISQDISEQEFQFLCGRGNVEKFHFRLSTICNSNETQIPLERMLMLLPRIRYFVFCPRFSDELPTQNKLSQLKLRHKLNFFVLFEINNEIDASDFTNFIKLNAAPNCFIHLRFCASVNTIEPLQKAAEIMFKNWKPNKEKPRSHIRIEI